MKFGFVVYFLRRFSVPALNGTLAGVTGLLFVSGCGKEDVRVYRVAKEQDRAPAANSSEPSQLPAGHPPITDQSPPHLTWTLPANWEELPATGMRAGSFIARSKDGKQADVSIVPLAGLAGGILGNVNRWRRQVGQAEITEAELVGAAKPIEISGQQGQFVEIVGATQDPALKTNILGAIIARNGTSWFFKMTGADSVVTEQKPIFLEFLKSIHFSSENASTGSAPAASQTASPRSEPTKPQWRVPKNWQEGPPSQFLVAKFIITGEKGAQAAVNVSRTGGELAANINRWRDQLSLENLSSEAIEKQLQTLAVPSGNAMLIDMHGTDSRTGQKARIFGAIVPLLEGGAWYYKLMGDEQLVEREKEAFIEFVKTVTYP